jgi:hypothetical protein
MEKLFQSRADNGCVAAFSAASRERQGGSFSHDFSSFSRCYKHMQKIATRDLSGSRDAHQNISFSSSRSLTFSAAARLSFALAIAQRRLSFFTFSERIQAAGKLAQRAICNQFSRVRRKSIEVP